jgi:hypothetical protein
MMESHGKYVNKQWNCASCPLSTLTFDIENIRRPIFSSSTGLQIRHRMQGSLILWNGLAVTKSNTTIFAPLGSEERWNVPELFKPIAIVHKPCTQPSSVKPTCAIGSHFVCFSR